MVRKYKVIGNVVLNSGSQFGEAVSDVKSLTALTFMLSVVLIRHKHNDHVGGNELLKEKFISTKYEPTPCATEQSWLE